MVTKSKGVAAEKQVQKSPAEFFAENQAIAGFDNLGKSLYTSIRELVENSLDACEAVHQLPDISVQITEYTQNEFNKLTTRDLRLSTSINSRGLTTAAARATNIASPQPNATDATDSPDCQTHRQIDTDLFQKKGHKSVSLKGESNDHDLGDEGTGDASSKKKAKKSEGGNKPHQYFLVTVTDNGCGMAHSAIPDLFGRVLSGSKYGVRQTRGKFGLGAKMALIWAKKSTGHPIHIQTVHRIMDDDDGETAAIPRKVSSCILDIDIYKNEPRVIEHSEELNVDGIVGTTVRVLIAGNWTTYKSRVVQYMQQLAIITPYASLSLAYTESSGKRNIFLSYDRRSEQMPATPVTVKHHPASVNNIIVQQLIQFTNTKTLLMFLTKELSAVSIPLAKRLITELSTAAGLSETMKPGDLTDKQITRLVQLFHQVQLFRAPDGTCLSPLGEYNLNLGIHKVLEPDLIATSRDKVSAYEGHPFVIEAAVSLGGKNVKEGVNVYRFANRIPLLFEGGADVATRVALTKIKWASYKIDYKRDKVGVFVSIVSTKIPFKGTSKEYIGDDATEIHQSVKRAIQSCCQQLRTHLIKRNALKDANTRKSKLTKYIPDVSRSLFGLLDGMRQRKREVMEETDDPSTGSNYPVKRLRLDESEASRMIVRLDRKEITESSIEQSLREAIEAENPDLDDAECKGAELAQRAAASVPLYIIPLYNLDDPSHDIETPHFTFRPIQPMQYILASSFTLPRSY